MFNFVAILLNYILFVETTKLFFILMYTIVHKGSKIT